MALIHKTENGIRFKPDAVFLSQCHRSLPLCAFAILLGKENVHLDALAEKNARYADYRKERYQRVKETPEFKEQRKAAYEAKKQDPEWVDKERIKGKRKVDRLRERMALDEGLKEEYLEYHRQRNRRRREKLTGRPYVPPPPPMTEEERRAKERAYNMRPEVKARRLAGYALKKNDPEFIKADKERKRKYFQKKKQEIYEYRNNRAATIPHVALAQRLRVRVGNALKYHKGKKAAKTEELTGCTVAFLKVYLESKFKDGMSWENHGAWEIDHIAPCAAFDLSDPEQQKKCFHYSNLQPLWASENRSKKDKVPNLQP